MSSNNAFGKLPSSANRNIIRPFEINIPTDVVQRMRTLIELAPIADLCYENSQSATRQYGVTHDWLASMKEKWLHHFDWKQHEARLNRLPHFRAKLSTPASNPLDVHFVGLFSSREDAMPVLLSHGWPGSFLEFIPLLDLVQKECGNDPSRLPYHFIVPSLPGFGFSSMAPAQEDFYRKESVAQLFNDLMVAIFGQSTRYVAQGGDVGSYISRALVVLHPNCVAAHLNFCPMSEPSRAGGESPLPVEDIEKRGLERAQTFRATGAAYALLQGTRPSTLGFALNSNPLALLAWIGEKFLDWADPASFPNDPPHDSPESSFATDILLGASLYWLTGHITTTFYSYREAFETASKGPPALSPDSPRGNVAAPKMLGFSWFPIEVISSPVSWVATTGNLVWWKRHEFGGHFAALERPEALWTDVREFLEVVAQKLGEGKA